VVIVQNYLGFNLQQFGHFGGDKNEMYLADAILHVSCV
jgi:hypothetical protein